MKNTQTRLMELESMLAAENEILGTLRACQKRMYECVVARDWVLLQDETAQSELITARFLAVEEKRIQLVRLLHPGAEGSVDFYTVSAAFPPETGKRINELFRELKRNLLLSKTDNDVFNMYVANARAMVSGLLETILPARKNKIYTRHGALATVPVESMVLNRSF